MNHQFLSFKLLRDNLSNTDMLIHIDFAENYSCKYGSEPQSVHFGASREQITLHTGVMYTSGEKQSFCTLSKSLKHDAPAIVTHLIPIFNKCLRKKPEISDVHIISDAPSTQYRNKTTFFLIVTFLSTLFPQIKTITHNFSEANHGKGPADGVGSGVKQALDRAVAHGEDVIDLDSALGVLKSSTKNIYIDVVEPKDIDIVREVSCDHLTPFKGTMSVHQWTWKRENRNYIHFNSMSCYDCPRGEKCKHYSIGQPWPINEEIEKVKKTKQVKKQPLKKIKNKQKKIKKKIKKN